MNKSLLIFAIISTSTEAFAPVVPKNAPSIKLDAKAGDFDVAKTVVASALSLSLLFGPTPALADGE